MSCQGTNPWCVTVSLSQGFSLVARHIREFLDAPFAAILHLHLTQTSLLRLFRLWDSGKNISLIYVLLESCVST